MSNLYKGVLRLSGLVCLISIISLSAAGQSLPRETKLFPHDPQQGALFGYSAGVDGDTMVLGAFLADGPIASSSGTAYVFQRLKGRWVEQAELVAADGQSFDWFGTSAAISGDTIVIGAPQAPTADGAHAGAAYVFRHLGNLWVQEGKLVASDPQDNSEYASDQGVAISGDTIVVGGANAANADPRTPFGTFGVVYVYQRTGSTWKQTARIANPDADTFAEFGYSVGVSGTGLVIGAPGSGSGDLAFAGATYIFRLQNGSWVQEAKLLASDGSLGAGFGSATGISLDTVAVSSEFGLNDSGDPTGSAYVFHRDKTGVWRQQARLSPQDGQAFDLYGERLAVSGDVLLVGSDFRANPAGVPVGAGYVYERAGDQWELRMELQPSDGQAFGEFGCSAATDGRTLLVGAGKQGVSAGPFSGEAYWYDFED